MPKFDYWSDVPGYAGAARRESEIRDVPFLGQPEIVAGIDCAPLTLRRVLWLQLTKSPFLFDLTFKQLATHPNLANEIIHFYWVVSPEFEAGNQRARKKFLKRTAKKLWRANLFRLTYRIQKYMQAAWLDAGEAGERKKSFYSSAAALTEFFNREYGLPIDVWENSRWRNFVRRLTGQPNILDMPLKIAWQLLRARRAAKQPDVMFSNRLSDPLVQKHFRNLNAGVPRLN